MNKFKLIILALTMYCNLSVLNAQDGNHQQSGTELSTLPSEQTYSQIQQTSGVPNLRAAPPGVEGNPQGQVPLGKTSYIVILCAAISLAVYKHYRKKLTKQQ